MIEAKLTVIGGNAEEEILLELPATIGRGKDNSISLRDSLISRQHCRIIEMGDRLVVSDLNSLNGTYIGSEKIIGQAELPPGSLLTVGTVTFRAIYGDILEDQVDSSDDSPHESSDILDEDTVDIGEAATMIDRVKIRLGPNRARICTPAFRVLKTFRIENVSRTNRQRAAPPWQLPSGARTTADLCFCARAQDLRSRLVRSCQSLRCS